MWAVAVDASAQGFRAVLRQEHENGTFRVIGSGSRPPTCTELRHVTIKKDGFSLNLACVEFRDIGKRIIFETVHKDFRFALSKAIA